MKDIFIKYNQNNTEKTQQKLNTWFENINPNCFVSVQFPKYLRKMKLEKAHKQLYKIMLNFERRIHGRHWNRKKTPFIAFAEHGRSPSWHYHIFFYNNNFSTYDFQVAFEYVSNKMKLPKETIFVEKIYDAGVYPYISKEIITDFNGHFDTDRIITTDILFETYKTQSKSQQKRSPGPQK